MATALDIVKDVYNRFASGDIDGFLALCDDNIEWVVNGPTALEKCKAYKGLGGVQEFLSILEKTWEFSEFTPREFLADRSMVVALGEEKGSDKKSGVQFQNRWAHVFEVKNGKIMRFREFLCHWSGHQKPPIMSWITA